MNFTEAKEKLDRILNEYKDDGTKKLVYFNKERTWIKTADPQFITINDMLKFEYEVRDVESSKKELDHWVFDLPEIKKYEENKEATAHMISRTRYGDWVCCYVKKSKDFFKTESSVFDGSMIKEIHWEYSLIRRKEAPLDRF